MPGGRWLLDVNRRAQCARAASYLLHTKGNSAAITGPLQREVAQIFWRCHPMRRWSNSVTFVTKQHDRFADDRVFLRPRIYPRPDRPGSILTWSLQSVTAYFKVIIQ